MNQTQRKRTLRDANLNEPIANAKKQKQCSKCKKRNICDDHHIFCDHIDKIKSNKRRQLGTMQSFKFISNDPLPFSNPNTDVLFNDIPQFPIADNQSITTNTNANTNINTNTKTNTNTANYNTLPQILNTINNY